MTDFCRFQQLSQALSVQGPPPQGPELCCSEKAKLCLPHTFQIHSFLENSSIPTRASQALLPQNFLNLGPPYHQHPQADGGGLRQVKPVPVFLRAGERTEQLLQPPLAVGANFAWMHPCGKEFSLEAQHRASMEILPRGMPVFSFSSGVALLTTQPSSH